MPQYSIKENLFLSSPKRSMRHGSDDMFQWTLFMMLLISFTLICWMGCFYIFGHPEKSFNYQLLLRLHKLNPPEQFELSRAPRGDFLAPKKLLDKFNKIKPSELRHLNTTLLHDFVENYHQAHQPTIYATGEYRILKTLPLQEKSFAYPGIVLLLQSQKEPQLLLQAIFTAENITKLNQTCKPGNVISLRKSYDLSVIIHGEKLEKGQILLTMIPLLYGPYTREDQASHQATVDPLFSLTPPKMISLKNGFTFFDPENLALTIKETKHIPTIMPRIIRLSQSLGHTTDAQAIPIEKEKGKRIDIRKAVAMQPLPSTPTATIPRAIPVNATATPPTYRAIPMQQAQAVPATQAIPSSMPTSPTILPAIPLNQAQQAQPTTAPSTPLNEDSLNSIDIEHFSSQPQLLTGKFIVSAASSKKAVLRYQKPPVNRNIRVILTYASPAEALTEGALTEFSQKNPLQITRMQKDRDGTLNVFVTQVE